MIDEQEQLNLADYLKSILFTTSMCKMMLPKQHVLMR